MTGTLPAVDDPARRALLVAATAANLAGWHDVHLRTLGFRTAWQDGWWLTPDDVPPIFFRAIAVRPGADPALPGTACHRTTWLAACDPWSSLDLAAHGLEMEADRPWMLRSAVPLPEVGPPEGVTLDRVTTPDDLEAFERAAAVGFGATPPTPGAWHAAPLLDDGRMALWVARHAGDTVATANGFREAGVLGIYSVSVLPEARRRGIGRAITIRAVSASPTEPAVLQPSEMAEPLYRRLGFERFTTFRTWTRRPV